MSLRLVDHPAAGGERQGHDAPPTAVRIRQRQLERDDLAEDSRHRLPKTRSMARQCRPPTARGTQPESRPRGWMIVPRLRASTGWSRSSRANPPLPCRRRTPVQRTALGFQANANSRPQDDCSCARIAVNCSSSSSPATKASFRSSVCARAARAASDKSSAKTGLRAISLARATSTNGAGSPRTAGACQRPGTADLRPIRRRPPDGADRDSEPPPAAGTIRAGRAVAESHGTEHGADALQVEAVPGQTPFQPVPVAVAHRSAPRLKSVVDAGVGGASPGTKSLLRRSSNVLACSTMSARSCPDRRSVCLTAAASPIGRARGKSAAATGGIGSRLTPVLSPDRRTEPSS